MKLAINKFKIVATCIINYYLFLITKSVFSFDVIVYFVSTYITDKITGIFGIVKQLLHLSARVRQTEEERQEENLRQSPTQTLLNCFMLGWFIIGKQII